MGGSGPPMGTAMTTPLNDNPIPQPAPDLGESRSVSEPHYRAAIAAFERDHPELLKLRRSWRRWVMYHGDKRIALAGTGRKLHQLARRMGLNGKETFVLFISDSVRTDEEPDCW